MSVHSGRMSRADAHTALSSARGTALSLSRLDLAARALSLQVLADTPPYTPPALQIRALLADVNEASANRLLASATIRPLTSPATVVYLFGAQSAQATGEAAVLAAQELSVQDSDLRLVDVTPVSTATWTGARYTFRVRAAWDPTPTPSAEAPSATLPRETPAPGTNTAPDLLQALSDSLSAARTSQGR